MSDKNIFSLRRILFYCVSIFFLHISDSLAGPDTTTAPSILLGISYSPRVSNVIIRKEDTPEYNYYKNFTPYIFSNVDFYIKYNLKNKKTFIKSGISYLMYGAKSNKTPVSKFAVYNAFEDTIPTSTYNAYLCIPFGVGRMLKFHKLNLEFEFGIIGNHYLSSHNSPLTKEDKSLLAHRALDISQSGVYTATEFISNYVRFAFLFDISKSTLYISPIYNLTLYNISGRNSKADLKYYQFGLNLGFQLHL